MRARAIYIDVRVIHIQIHVIDIVHTYHFTDDNTLSIVRAFFGFTTLIRKQGTKKKRNINTTDE